MVNVNLFSCLILHRYCLILHRHILTSSISCFSCSNWMTASLLMADSSSYSVHIEQITVFIHDNVCVIIYIRSFIYTDSKPNILHHIVR